MHRLCKGDVLISEQGNIGGIVGHAALMGTSEWVLEMPGPANSSSTSGKSYNSSSSWSNNRRISKQDWCRLHRDDTVNVWRSRNSDVAEDAADWAYRRFYNPNGGAEKTQHITYKISVNVGAIDPSYCSKLVVHSFRYGTGDRWVIKPFIIPEVIIPVAVPKYFWPKYRLEWVCRI